MSHMDGINKRALFSDETEDYRCPAEPDAGDEVLLRFRTAKGDADAVFLVEENSLRERKLELEPAAEEAAEDRFDFFRIRVRMTAQR